jgi:hypothetical protein
MECADWQLEGTLMTQAAMMAFCCVFTACLRPVQLGRTAQNLSREVNQGEDKLMQALSRIDIDNDDGPSNRLSARKRAATQSK